MMISVSRETSCRVALSDPSSVTDPVVRAVFREIEQELGFGIVPNVFRAMAGQPTALRATWDLFRATVLQGELPRTVKEMVGIVVSAANGSDYALKVHLHSLGVQGVAADTLEALAAGSDAPSGIPASTAAIIRIAYVAAHDGPLAVRDQDLAMAMDAGLTQEEIGEVFGAINLFQAINSFTDLVRVPVDAI